MGEYKIILEKAIVPDIKDGCPTKEDWEARRKLILNTLSEIEYGKRPAVDYAVTWKELLREPVESLHAIHMRTEITVQTSYGAISFPVTVFLPKQNRKVPAAILICSENKHAEPPHNGTVSNPTEKTFRTLFQQFGILSEDPDALIATFLKNAEKRRTCKANTLDLDTDYDTGHWPVREMLKQNFAMVGFYANDAEPDIANQFPSKLASIFGTQKQRKAHEWGILSVWAFAAQCVMDYVEQIPEIDSSQVTLAGHSRCGKVALWYGANDERFHAVMANGSGCCGASLSLGKTGENLFSIQTAFPHWFAPAFLNYACKEKELPFDQHFLLATVAPRILHIGSGSKDAWSDPEGEYFSTFLASKAWEYYMTDSTYPKMTGHFPSANEHEIAGKVGYHLREGEHLLDTFDWMCLVDHLKRQ